MLRKMRSDFKKYSWTLWLVILTFLIGFSFIDAFRGKARGKNDLIFIGDSVIKAEEYQKQLMMTLQMYKMQFKDNFNKKLITQMRIPDQILQTVVNDAIIRAEAKKLNIIASKEELKQKVLTHPWFQRDGKFAFKDEKEYEYFLNRAFGIDITDFEKLLKYQIISDKFRELITSALVIDNDTLKEKFKKEKDKAELEYILLKPNRIKDKIEVNESEINDYYQENKEDFKSPERRSGNVIALKFEDYKNDITIDDKEVFDHFKDNKSQYMDPEKIKVSRILLKYEDEKKREEIQKKAEELQKELTKENFAQKAKEFSQDNKAKEGGDYGYFGWKNFTKQEISIINSLNENEISSPVATKDGFAILLVSEKKEKQQKEFGKVKPIIRDSIEKQKLNTLVKNKLTEIYEKAQNVINIKTIAEKQGIKVVETGLLTNGEIIKDLDENGYISRQLFRLKEKETSSPMMLPKGMAVVQLVKTEKPMVEPLEKVKEKVKNEVIRVRKVKRLMDQAHTMTTELNNMKDEKKIEKFLKDKELASTSTTYTRGNRLAHLPMKKGLDNLIFSLEEKEYASPIDLKNEVAIVKLKSKKVTGTWDFEKDKKEFYDQKLREMKNSFFTSYVYKKREDYDVRINQELYQEVKDHILTRIQ
jgi:peptidyl-prolyl cis-trans isomerase D